MGGLLDSHWGIADRFVSQLSPTGGSCLELHLQKDSESSAGLSGKEYWY